MHTYSAYVPRTVSPSRCQVRHMLSRPETHMSHFPQPRLALMTTRSPGFMPVAWGPRAVTSPAPSAPLICGSSNLIPGQPRRTAMSIRLRAAARRRTRTWSPTGSGVGKSAYSRTSGPPCWWKSTAFMGMIRCKSVGCAPCWPATRVSAGAAAESGRAQFRPRDHQPLNLAGSLIDLGDLGIPEIAFHGQLATVSHATVDLDGRVSAIHRSLGGKELCHG